MTLTLIAYVSLAVAGLCALIIAIDEVKHPQKMGVMNVVWPVTALYSSVLGLWAYFAWGRPKSKDDEHAMDGHHGMQHDTQQGKQQAKGQEKPKKPTPVQVAIGTSHCGAGCTIADLGTEFAVAGAGLVLFGSMLWTDYLLDFVVAWALGILFQYFAIKPMRNDLSAGQAVWAAVKADTLSILAFQIGMYLWMALVYFKLFPAPHHLTPFDVRYWLMMQVAMICGYATSYPMNRLLIGTGLKEAM